MRQKIWPLVETCFGSVSRDLSVGLFYRKVLMIFSILIFIASAQVDPFNTPKELPPFSYEWCLENARMKDELVGKGGCVWKNQPNHAAIVGPGPRRYICQPYPAILPPNTPARPEGSTLPKPGYEGRLSCPSPFTSTPDYIIYECAHCATSDVYSGTVDSACRSSMYYNEQAMCGNQAQKFDFKHEIGGLVQLPGGPIPPPDPPLTP